MNRILTSLILTALTLHATDWPQWRGPNRDGISKETGLLKSWPEAGPKLEWKATGMGDSYTSPSVVGGQIFGMGLFDQDESVWALDTTTGKLLWKTRIGDAARVRQTQGGHGPRSTPTVAGTLLYVEGAGGTIACLQASNGKVVWTKSLVSDFGGAAPGWGFSESPLVDGERILVTPGGQGGAVVALNKQTGETVWATKDFKDRAEYSNLVAAEIGGVKQYIQLTGQNVVGIAPDSGKVLWTVARQGKTATIPTPIISGDQVYVASGYGVGCNAFAVAKDTGGFKATEIWLGDDGSRPMAGNMINHHGVVILVDGYLYGHSDKGGWTCQNFKTGKVEWSDRGVGKGSVTCVDGLLFCRSESGSGAVAIVEVNPKAYVEKGRFNQPDRSNNKSWAHPVVANGKLYLRDMDVLLCYDVKAK